MLEEQDIKKIGEEMGKVVEKKINPRFDQLIVDLGQVIEDNINPQFEELRKDVITIQGEMVTKTYLDDKFGDFHRDLVTLVRKEDKKVDTLVSTLHGKSVLDDRDVKQIQEIEVFPQPPQIF